MLVITCLEGQFGINCLSVFQEILKFSVKISKNLKGNLSQKLPEPNLRLMVNQTKLTITSH